MRANAIPNAKPQSKSYSNPLPPPNPILAIELLFALLNSAIFAVFSALLLALASTIVRLSSALAWYASELFLLPPLLAPPPMVTPRSLPPPVVMPRSLASELDRLLVARRSRDGALKLLFELLVAQAERPSEEPELLLLLLPRLRLRRSTTAEFAAVRR